MTRALIFFAISIFCFQAAFCEFQQSFFNPPFYFQEDSKWCNVTLGYGPATIGCCGCLLTSVSSMLAGQGVYVNGVIPDPIVMNDWLLANDGFIDGWGFVWESIEALGFKLEGFVNDTASTIQALNEGKRIFLHVNHNNHYVLALKDTGYGYEVMDPYFNGRIWNYTEVSVATIYSYLN